MVNRTYKIQIKINDQWMDQVRTKEEPYWYSDLSEAANMANISRPDMVRSSRLGDVDLVRIKDNSKNLYWYPDWTEWNARTWIQRKEKGE